MTKFITALLSLALIAGCAGSTSTQKAEQAASTGNGIAEEIDKLLSELLAEGITFNQGAREEDPAIKEMKADDLKTVTKKLDRMVAAIGEYVAILNRDDIKMESGVNKNDVRAAYTALGVRAGKHLKFANKRMIKLQTTKSKAG